MAIRRNAPPKPAGIVFGLPPSLSHQRHPNLPDAIATYLSKQIGSKVTAYQALSYDDLSTRVASGDLHAAWLPPALYVELERTVGLRAIAAAQRGGGVGYHAAFFTRIDSDIATIEDIPGHSVGWVDPGSASGYVFPRLQLAAYGIDPTVAFQEEVFLRSHDAVVRAVVDRAVDVGATFVHLDPDEPRKVLRAGWLPGPADTDATNIRWLDPFGPLPPDVVASTLLVPEPLAKWLSKAFLAIHEVPEVCTAAQRQFGTGRFVAVESGAYQILRRAMDMAEGQGVEVSASLRPSLLV
jgi:phosphate/phosphite/phosphonate ABC transporter binding protein